MNKYTSEQVEFLTSRIYGRSYKELIGLFKQQFGTELSFGQLKGFIGNRKLSTGRNGQFEKGFIPFNKGKKGIGGWEPTQFKKGNKPHNYKPIGTERVNGDGYIDVKVADPNKWKGKYVFVWEKENGNLPKGHAVIFGDGDRRNFSVNNLILVSRKQLMVLNRNKLIQRDADLTRSSVTLADIYLKISARRKRE
jgi:hypothetical protein